MWESLQWLCFWESNVCWGGRNKDTCQVLFLFSFSFFFPFFPLIFDSQKKGDAGGPSLWNHRLFHSLWDYILWCWNVQLLKPPCTLKCFTILIGLIPPFPSRVSKIIWMPSLVVVVRAVLKKKRIGWIVRVLGVPWKFQRESNIIIKNKNIIQNKKNTIKNWSSLARVFLGITKRMVVLVLKRKEKRERKEKEKNTRMRKKWKKRERKKPNLKRMFKIQEKFLHFQHWWINQTIHNLQITINTKLFFSPIIMVRGRKESFWCEFLEER